MSILNLFSRDYHSLYDATLSLYDSINFFFLYINPVDTSRCKQCRVRRLSSQRKVIAIFRPAPLRLV